MAPKHVLGMDIGTTYLRLLRASPGGNAGGALDWETPMLRNIDEQGVSLILEINAERSDIAIAERNAVGDTVFSYGQKARQKWLESPLEQEERFLCEFKPFLEQGQRGESVSGGVRLCAVPDCGTPALPGTETCRPCGVGLRPQLKPAGNDVAARADHWLERLLARVEQDLSSRLYTASFKKQENWALCVGMPASWSEATRQRLQRTLTQAFPGKTLEVVHEAEAALRYQLGKLRYLGSAGGKQDEEDREFAARTQGGAVFVVDIGATATTITLCRRLGDRVEVDAQTPAWQERFSGEALDRQFGLHIAKKLGLEVSGSLPPALQYRGRELKEQFSNAANNRQTRCQMTMTLQIGGRRWDPTVRFDKATFESDEFAGATIRNCDRMLENAASHYRIQVGQVAGVLVIGGGASWYFVKERLAAALPRTPIALGAEPHLAVARGLALLPFARADAGVRVPPPPPLPENLRRGAEAQPKPPKPPEVPPLPIGQQIRNTPPQAVGPIADEELHLSLTSAEARQGGSKRITVNGRQELIRIPPRMVGTQKLAFDRQGRTGSQGQRGRLIVYVTAEADVLVDLQITRAEAEQGCQKPIRVEKLGGERIVLTIPPRTGNDQKLYLEGRGRRTAAEVGALIARIRIIN